MVRFQCDSCGGIKEKSETWILGLAAENIGVTSARRELSIASTWEDKLAVDPLAVHLCSQQCRSDYMTALFGDSPDTFHGDPTVARRRMKRVTPVAVVDTVVSEKTKPTLRTPKRRKTA